MEQLISITIIFLILSLMTEKITTLIKLHYRKLGIKRLTDEEEKERAKEITRYSLGIGIIVALSLKANIFAMIASSTPGETLVWGSDKDKFPLFLIILGSILTGVVLSLGSKFWQDLLDLLLETRNLKRKLKEEKTYQIESSKELLEYLEKTEGETVEKVLEENKNDLMSIENVAGVGVGVKEKGGKRLKSIVVHVTEKKKGMKDVEALKKRRQLIPQKLYFKSPSGQVKEIPVDVIEVGEVEASYSISPGGTIANKNNDYAGTFGCVVKDTFTRKELILTCYHVLRSGHPWNWLKQMGREDVFENVNTRGKKIGRLIHGTRTKRLDMALVEPDEGIELEKEIVKIGTPKAARKVTWDDVFSEIDVSLKGKTSSKVKAGKVINKNVAVKIKYYDSDPKRRIWELENLMVLAERRDGNWKPITQSGDSGAIVLDRELNALGMIVATAKNVSYAIPIVDILEHAGLDIA